MPDPHVDDKKGKKAIVYKTRKEGREGEEKKKEEKEKSEL